MYYVHKDSLVEVDRGENGNIIVNGWTQTEITEEKFYEEYVAVRKIRMTRKKVQSPFELAYAEQLANFSLESNEENEQYINGTQALIQNKPL